MKPLTSLLFLLAACLEMEPEPQPQQSLDPSLCPAPPFEHCGVIDGGFDVWCEAGEVKVDDLTAQGYCEPNSSELVCTTGGHNVFTRHTCASGACIQDATKHYFDYVGDYMNFDVTTLCAP
jgi:hypothetical protein